MLQDVQPCFSHSHHSKPWPISSLFTSDCVAGIQFYPKVIFCWIFSQSTVILSQASHTNDWQQLKLACILNAYEIHSKGLTIFKPLTQVFLHEENQKMISKAVATKQKHQII